MEQKTSRLVDFYDHRKWLKEDEWGLLQEEPPTNLSMWSDGLLASLRQQLTDALSDHAYHKLEAILTRTAAVSPEDGAHISNQLAFLFPANMAPGRRAAYWAQHKGLLAWKSDLWCIVSQDSACIWNETDCLDVAAREQNAPAEHLEQSRALAQNPRPVPAEHINETPQQRGARLETVSASAGMDADPFRIRRDFPSELQSLLPQPRPIQAVGCRRTAH